MFILASSSLFSKFLIPDTEILAPEMAGTLQIALKRSMSKLWVLRL